jgi:hypothetical protein
VASTLALRRTPIRQAIYQLLVDSSREAWTVAGFSLALADRITASRETVRATLYALAHSGVLRAQPDPRRLQFVLDSAGAERLRSIVAEWRAAEHCVGPPPPSLMWSVDERPGGQCWQWIAPPHGCPGAPASPIAPPCQTCRENRFTLTTRLHGGHAAMATVGTLNFPKTPMLTEAVAAVLAGPVQRLLLDVTGVWWIDEAGVHTLKGLRRAAAIDRRGLVVAHRQPRSVVAERLGAAGLLARHPVSPRPTRPAARAIPLPPR